MATLPEKITVKRADFLAAEAALKRGDLQIYQQIRSGLTDYPLSPYLDSQALQRRLDKITTAEAEYFLLQYRNTPVASRFRRILLNSLGKQKRWQEYLQFYRPDRSNNRRCLHAQALLKTGRTDAALKEAPLLWMNGKSMPAACDPVFSAWRSAGQLTTSLLWDRIELALAKRNLRLAKYLQRYLPVNERHWLKLLLETDKKPEIIADSKKFSGKHAMRTRILLHGLKRMARKQPAQAAVLWKKLKQDTDFNADQRYQVERALAKGWMRTSHPEAIAKLDGFKARQDDHKILEARIREALSRHAWKKALDWIESLPRALSEQENWQYWRARALQVLGKRKKADILFQDLSEERSYHGFLAADKTGRPYNLDHRPLTVSNGGVAALADRAGFRRAHELFQLGRLINARREWRAATLNLDTEQMKSAAKLAQKWGWHDQAIFTLAKTGYWDDLELRFPLKHEAAVTDAANRKSLDKSWVLAVIRQESAFSPDARSHAGALGLMQLMPATARETARKMKRRPPRRRELLQPETNIDIGTSYLKSVYDRLSDNTVLAISAYNAGPHRVLRWLPERELEADLWVETIPFRETRRYTQRVLAYAVIYDQRLGQKITQLKERMPNIMPKKVKIQSASL